jgi:microcystin-dependent protein
MGLLSNYIRPTTEVDNTYVLATADYSVTSENGARILADATGGSLTITLPEITITAGAVIDVATHGVSASNTVTIDAQSLDIDDASTLVLDTDKATVRLVYDSLHTKWVISYTTDNAEKGFILSETYLQIQGTVEDTYVTHTDETVITSGTAISDSHSNIAIYESLTGTETSDWSGAFGALQTFADASSVTTKISGTTKYSETGGEFDEDHGELEIIIDWSNGRVTGTMSCVTRQDPHRVGLFRLHATLVNGTTDYVFTRADNLETGWTIPKLTLDVASKTITGLPMTMWTTELDLLTSYTITNTNAVVSTNADAGIRTVGEIVTVPFGTPPNGTLECDGSAISRTVYADLFEVIGTSYGDGDTSTTFNIPDYRGEFLRGLDNGRGLDPNASTRTDRGDGTVGDFVGTNQASEFESHSHGVFTVDDTGQNGGSTISNNDSTPDQTITTTTAGGAETRPTNINVMYCIAFNGNVGNAGSNNTLIVADEENMILEGSVQNPIVVGGTATAVTSSTLVSDTTVSNQYVWDSLTDSTNVVDWSDAFTALSGFGNTHSTKTEISGQCRHIHSTGSEHEHNLVFDILINWEANLITGSARFVGSENELGVQTWKMYGSISGITSLVFSRLDTDGDNLTDGQITVDPVTQTITELPVFHLISSGWDTTCSYKITNKLSSGGTAQLSNPLFAAVNFDETTANVINIIDSTNVATVNIVGNTYEIEFLYPYDNGSNYHTSITWNQSGANNVGRTALVRTDLSDNTKVTIAFQNASDSSSISLPSTADTYASVAIFKI